MNKTGRQAIRTTSDDRSQFCDVTQIGLETSPATSRTRRERLRCVFSPLEEEIVNKSCFPSTFKMQTMFTPILNHDKLA